MACSRVNFTVTFTFTFILYIYIYIYIFIVGYYIGQCSWARRKAQEHSFSTAMSFVAKYINRDLSICVCVCVCVCVLTDSTVLGHLVLKSNFKIRISAETFF